MHSNAECSHCEGSGNCPACDGTGNNPHLDSSDPKCPDCLANPGLCLECDGTGKSSIAMPIYSGNLLRHGLLWAGIVAGFWLMVSLANSRIVIGIAVLVWLAFWYVVFYRTREAAGKSRSESRMER